MLQQINHRVFDKRHSGLAPMTRAQNFLANNSYVSLNEKLYSPKGSKPISREESFDGD
jgi:hypothetical protein